MATTLSPRGLLFAFEGIDGAGKTTQARSLARLLRAMGMSVVESKEPTNGTWGRQLRESGERGRLAPEQELELFIRDRREHVSQLIEPSLTAGSIVIVDRYYFSTAAYQGARGMDVEEILRLNETFAPQPDLLFLLTVPPSIGRERIAARGDRANLFEDEAALGVSAEIFERIQRPYLRRLDGQWSISELEHTVLLAASKMIEKRLRPAPDPHGPTAADLLAEANELLADDSVPVGEKAQALLERLGIEVPKPA